MVSMGSDLGIPVKRQSMNTLNIIAPETIHLCGIEIKVVRNQSFSITLAFKFESKNFNDVNNFLEKYGLYAFQHRFLERIRLRQQRRAAHLEAFEQFLDEQSNREESTSLTIEKPDPSKKFYFKK
ncbi:hypothetical protein BpHYR1_028020 [Brachionus plicatilis]|uniref:Uncharacterized protein n=1 Tax=Brachionus plicatilis TaxID=10195 RepID=A0A3M7R378_BRAPC|nr:hypothetical protein BpHYR1_028020 [Brachionus plicatilis]